MKYIIGKELSDDIHIIDLDNVFLYTDYSIFSSSEYLSAYYYSPINTNVIQQYKKYIVIDTIDDNEELLPHYLMPIYYEINDKDIKGINSNKITENTFKELLETGVITDVELFIDSICKKFKFKKITMEF